MVILLWAQAGYSMVLLSAAIKGVPEETLEAARIDGAGAGSIFFRIVVPQIKGTIITVFITVLITVMKIFDIVYVMTNGSFNTNVVGTEFFNQLFTFFDYGTASAIVVLLMIAVDPGDVVPGAQLQAARRQSDGNHRSTGSASRTPDRGRRKAARTPRNLGQAAVARPDRPRASSASSGSCR